MEFNFLQKEVDVDGKGNKTTVGAIVLGILLVVFRYYSNKADEVTKNSNPVKPQNEITELKQLTGAKHLQSDERRKFVNYQIKSGSESNAFKFPPTQVCELTDEIRGYFLNNVTGISEGAGAIISRLRCIDYCIKDFPETKENFEKKAELVKEMYGPALAMYASLMKKDGKYDGPLEHFFDINIEQLKKEAKKNPDLIIRYPFVFDKKYEKNGLSYLDAELKVFTDERLLSSLPSRLLVLHPKVLTFDSDFIFENLTAKFGYPYTFGNTERIITLCMPRYMTINNKGDDQQQSMIFSSDLDSAEAIYKLLEMPSGIKANSAQEYLSILGDKQGLVKDIIGNFYNVQKVTDIKTSQENLGDKVVLVISFNSKSNDILNAHKIYIIASVGHLWSFSYKVSGPTEKSCRTAMERHTKLHKQLVAGVKIAKQN